MAKMKVITPVIEITHGGETTTLKGSDAQNALSQFKTYNGVGNLHITHFDSSGNLTGFMFCCDDTWKRLPNEVSEVDTRDCGFDCADELAFAEPVSQINHSTGKPIQAETDNTDQPAVESGN